MKRHCADDARAILHTIRRATRRLVSRADGTLSGSVQAVRIEIAPTLADLLRDSLLFVHDPATRLCDLPVVVNPSLSQEFRLKFPDLDHTVSHPLRRRGDVSWKE